MAAPPSSLFSRHGILRRRFESCLVDIHDGVQTSHLPELPRRVSLQISYDNNSVLLLRFRASVNLRDNPDTTDIFLDIPANKLISLSLCQRPDLPERLSSSVQPSQTRLRLVLPSSAGMLIAPLPMKTLNPATPSDAQVLSAMRRLSESPTIITYLPPGGDLHLFMSLPNLTTSPERLLRLATSRSHLDLNTFYRGKGGRVIPPSEAFGYPVISDAAQAGRDIVLPAAEPPPSYNEDFPPASARKRRRSGEGSDNKPKSLDAHGVLAHAAEVIENLHASTAAAAAMDARLRATLREIETAQGCELGRQRRMSSVPRATSASPSPTASKGETASRASSVSEAISERLKAYLDERLEQFQQDVRAFYDSRLDESLADRPTTEHMEQFVRMEFEEATVDLIEETRMWEAIQEAVDKVEDDMRRRMLDAWND